MYVPSAHNICSTIYDFIIYTVTVCKVYAGDNTTIIPLFSSHCTYVIPPIPTVDHMSSLK